MKRRLSQSLGGAFIFAMAGGAWGLYGVYALHESVWLLAVPVVIAALEVLGSMKLERRVNALPDEAVSPERQHRDARARKIFVGVNVAQGIAIFVAVQVAFNLHQPEYLAPAIALIVGLHFFALARPMELPSHWMVGGLMCLIAVGTVAAVPQENWGPVVGLGCAATLWVFSAHRLHEVQSAL